MRDFAGLLDGLAYRSGRNAKLRLIADYLDRTGDPERGYALAALTGELDFAGARAGQIREMIQARTDATLFALSYDYVGDLAETVALMWPGPEPLPNAPPPSLAEVVTRLSDLKRAEVQDALAGWLDRCNAAERWALLKLITGGLRIGISARLARTAFAQWSGLSLNDIEEIWHGLEPPYAPLFAWATGAGPRPDPGDVPTFKPFMLANPLEDRDREKLDLAAYLAEWKWDGIRVQLVSAPGGRKLFSRTGEDISAAFPDVFEGVLRTVALDGELLIGTSGHDPRPFSDLQKRLNRKTPDKTLLKTHPAFIRVYDILSLDGEDLRPRPLSERRRFLAGYMTKAPPRLDLSIPVPDTDWAGLERLWTDSRTTGLEGLMLKRRDSPYSAGRPKGPWFKWKRAPLLIDAVMMYAQRGHGRRSSFYSDYTFGVWRESELVPVGKAYFGFSDTELAALDKWVRGHTTERFGPVRAVAPELVLEIAFDALQRSSRHKSGVAMRFPRIHRIRWDKPAAEADRLETLWPLLEAAGGDTGTGNKNPA